MTATNWSDVSDYGEGSSATKDSRRKKLISKTKQSGGNDRRTKQSKQPTVNSSPAVAATSTSIEPKYEQESQLRRKSKLENKDDANKEELGAVVMKLEGKRPMC